MEAIKIDLHVRLIFYLFYFTLIQVTTREQRKFCYHIGATHKHAPIFFLHWTTGYSSSLIFSAAGALSVAATVSTSEICSFSLMNLAMSLTLNFFETLIGLFLSSAG